VLDQILLAVEAGAELRPQFLVEGFLRQNGAITGIVGRETGRVSRMTDSARLVIGADGRHSRLAQSVGAAAYEVVAPLNVRYFSYWSGDFEKLLAISRRLAKGIVSLPGR
jgi:flavin-dependent dehydrogenase